MFIFLKSVLVLECICEEVLMSLFDYFEFLVD